ncbi:MAG: permease [Oceanococcus sp.]
MLALIGSLLALAAGPLIYSRAAPHSWFGRALDGFVFVAIGGLVMLEILPEVVEHAGWWVLPIVALGLWGPSWLEKVFRRAAHRTHMITVLLSAVGLVVHTVFDGAALTQGGSAPLGLAIVIHRIPVSLAVWWLLRPSWGPVMPLIMLAAMAGGTVAGYLLGGGLQVHEAEAGFAALQAFVAGSILHVVFNRPHLDDSMNDAAVKPDQAEGLGSVLGLLAFAVMLASQIALDHAPIDALNRLLELSLAAAPALLLAYLAGGLVAAFLPESSVVWLSRGGNLSQAFRGMTVGMPLPVCSCGVVPLYQSLIRRGAPPSAAMAFLIATPEIGLDAILVSIPLLGMDMTIARVVAAAFVALLVGWFVGRWVQVKSSQESCCHKHAPEFSGGAPQRLKAGLRYGFGDLVDSTAPWILFGLIVAAAAQPLLEHSWLQQIPPAAQVVAFALLGLPLYVCATGSTPIVAVMLLAGVSPGAALAFLLTGPATNPATFGVLARLHGRKAATAFGVATGGLAIVCGLVLNRVVLDIELAPPHLHAFPSWLAWSSLFALGLLVVASVARRGARRFMSELQLGQASAAH